MGSEPVHRARHHRLVPALAAAGLPAVARHGVARACQAAVLMLGGLAMASAAAQPAPPTTGIYTCVDERGRRLTADRPIPECLGREQQILNRDGSVRATVPPTLTAEERAALEARERAALEARAAQADAVRRDRNLVSRYPDEQRHRSAREAALDTVRLAMRNTESRLQELAQERKPLTDEAEFYDGKVLPPKLRAALDANDAAVEAQRAAAVNQQAELVRINRIYDAELARLRQLWGGARPGSLGPLPSANAPGSRADGPRDSQPR